jgi:hypothetical protein
MAGDVSLVVETVIGDTHPGMRVHLLAHAGLGATLWLAACAQGSSGDDPGADAQQSVAVDAGGGADAAVAPDAAVGQDAAIPDAAPPDAAPPDAAIPDAAPPDAAPPDAIPCQDTVVQLLSNANFDQGPGGGWVETSQFALINHALDLPVAPESGNYAVWMGGAPDASDILHQDVAVPVGARDLHLAGHRWIASEDTGGTANDTVVVELRTTGGALLENLTTWSNVNRVGTWTGFNLLASGDYAGQTIRLRLRSQTDATLNTNFFFDTFALRATVCQ